MALLDQIANPQIANILGQFAAGQQTGRTNRLQAQARGLGNLSGQEQQEGLRKLGAEAPEQAAQIQKLFGGIDKQNLQSAFFDIAAAASVGGDNQISMLRQAQQKLSGNPTASQVLQSAIDEPDQVKRDERIIGAMQLGVTMGVLPSQAGTADTAGQRERADLTKGLSDEDKAKSRRIALGLDPRAVGSASQTITGAGTAEEVAETEAIIAQRKKFAEMTGSSRSQAIDKGFDKVQKLTQNISNLDNAVEAVRAGAGTGAITKRFPSIRGSSVLLDQVQGALALDVIGSVTFGALSEGELNLAKAIAIPTGLEGPELITWIQDKKTAQTKLLGYFQDQIDFLDQGGSVAGFLRSKRRGAQNPQGQQQAQQPQAQLGANQQALPQGVTEDDIATTMQANNMTREQVLQRLGGGQ